MNELVYAVIEALMEECDDMTFDEARYLVGIYLADHNVNPFNLTIKICYAIAGKLALAYND